MVTVEEHSVIGGLGDAVADVLMGKVNCKFRKIGINDCFGQSGKAKDVLREYGLTATRSQPRSRRLCKAHRIYEGIPVNAGDAF